MNYSEKSHTIPEGTKAVRLKVDVEKPLRQEFKVKQAARVKATEAKAVTASASDKREALKNKVDSKLSEFEIAVAKANKMGLIASLNGEDRRQVFLDYLREFGGTGVIALSE